MPRCKRWLNHSGLHVPFIVYVPEQYRHLMKDKPGSENTDLINFTDLGPTTLNLAGIKVPDYMQGISFMGQKIDEPRKYMAAPRSRADNMYEVSRAERDERYIYSNCWMPQTRGRSSMRTVPTPVKVPKKSTPKRTWWTVETKKGTKTDR